MFRKALSCELLWDGAIGESVAERQQWVLSTMHKHGQDLVTMLWRILGNEQDVCDAYQDTFLQLAHFEGGRKPDHVKAYVFRVANNVAISILRRRLAEKNRLAMPATIREAGCCPANELDSQYLQETLRGYIARLPEHLRNVVTLRDLAELSYAQVARVLGISAATARVYRCKAVQLLAVWMGKEE